jgi:hypothetical protein
VQGITHNVSTRFVWEFNGQDLAGMALPRVSKSLERGAIPYNPDLDPEAQKKKGLSRVFYIAHQRLKRANWPNLREEMLREAASGPGLLAGGSIGIFLLRFAGRLMPSVFKGRRANELSRESIQEMGSTFNGFLEERNHQGRSIEPTRDLIKDFYKSLFGQEINDHGQNLLEKRVPIRLDLLKPASDPEYTLKFGLGSGDYIKHLVEDNIDGLGYELPGYQKRWPLLRGLTNLKNALTGHRPEIKIKERQKTLNEIVDQWAEAMADHAQLEWDGVKRNFFSKNKVNHKAQARLNYWSQMLEKAVIELNRDRWFTHQFKADHWLIRNGRRGIKEQGVGGRQGVIRFYDKFRDVIVNAGMQVRQGSKSSLKDAMNGTVKHLESMAIAKFFLFGGFTCGWLWWLAHYIQKGRNYPANRLLSEAGVMPPTQGPGAQLTGVQQGRGPSIASSSSPPLECSDRVQGVNNPFLQGLKPNKLTSQAATGGSY